MLSRSVFIIMISLLTTVSCQQTNRLLDQNEVFEDQFWAQEQLVVFDFEILDSVSVFDFSLNLRNSMDYPFRNLYFLYSIKDDNGNLVLSDQQQILLFSKAGRPLGSRTGLLGIEFGDDYYSSSQFLKHQFLKPGKYTINISQNMRGQQVLEGVMLVGVKIMPSLK